MTKDRGFTLIELMVTLSIAAVLAGLAVPSMVGMVRQNRITTTANDLVSASMYARSEAVLRGTPIVICATDDANGASPACVNTGSWSAGWIVFIDTNGDGDTSLGETVLRVWPTLQGEISLTPDAKNSKGVSFSRTGAAEGISSSGKAAGASFKICAASSPDGRVTSFNTTGRALTKKISSC